MAQFNLSTVCLLILLSLSLFNLQAHAGELPLDYIKGFSIQDNRGRCNINAVIFLTLKGRKLCADPTSEWVRKRIQQLR
ncbi:hypothetical protein SKAU_G00198310 [Synaphobranchus kaupii]|uniref:Chemokine interleukin-8-like domain-containing protein n=1 Tax=Synaphobranchus kaupii TaxID=118154 RepID=A0A9Q1IVV5_SYNKA|nr:hypothetical protein SKAU_G00198310 [Synaphobranchus kaupii]